MFIPFLLSVISPESNKSRIDVLEAKLNLLIGIHGLELIAIIVAIIQLGH